MAETTGISWADATFNPWVGCQKVSPACDNCYAEALMDGRFGGRNWGPGAPRRRTSVQNWNAPRRWNRKAAGTNKRIRVFCSSLADVFDNAIESAWRADLWQLIRETPHLDWMLLTKRPQNFAKMLPPDWGEGYDNVWLGTSVENETERKRRVPVLKAVPAKIRFLSCEPLLSDLNLADDLADGEIHWVIVGGESGPDARPMHPDWARSLRDQCAAAGVPFFFKQWGEWQTRAFNASTGLAVFRQFDSFQHWVNKAPTWVRGGICLDRHGKEMKTGGDMAKARDAGNFPVIIMHKVGKKEAGDLLDGLQHHAWPTAAVESRQAAA